MVLFRMLAPTQPAWGVDAGMLDAKQIDDSALPLHIVDDLTYAIGGLSREGKLVNRFEAAQGERRDDEKRQRYQHGETGGQ